MIDIKGILNPLSTIKFLGKAPHTIKYPTEEKKTADRYRGVHHNDIEACIGCGNCSTICENDAIDMVDVGFDPSKGNTGYKPIVDYGRCCWCALCVDVCPSGSLSLTKEYVYVDDDASKFLYVPGLQELGAEIKSVDDLKELGKTNEIIKLKEGEKSWFQANREEGLLEFDRIKMKELPGKSRIKSFAEVVLGYTEEEAFMESIRCLGCGVCVAACPDTMHIPEYIQAITDRDYKKSLNIIYENNPLPEMCGKVCTRECETACVYHNRGDAVAIRWLKRFTTEQFNDFKGIINAEVKPFNGKKVGIIGGGPAGLTAGYYLRLRGYDVTIYEALSKAGGMTMAGIPKYRFPQDSLDKQISYMEEMGVKIKYNTRVGRDITFDEIMDTYDAVFIGIGFHDPYTIGIKGEKEATSGVIPAVELLRKVNFGEKVDVGKRVAVIGGGNVAIDGARVSKRLGDIDVTILYRRRVQDMPADWEEIEGAEDEMVNIVPQAIPQEIILDKNGKVTGIKYIKAEMVSDGKGGRPRPVPIEGSETILPVDTVIAAIGQQADYSFLPSKYQKKTEKKDDKDEMGKKGAIETFWGRIKVHGYNETTMKKVFSGGDMVNRTADAISAIADGLNAVKGIDLFLTGKDNTVIHSLPQNEIDKDALLERHYKMKHEKGKLVAVKLDLSGKIVSDNAMFSTEPDDFITPTTKEKVEPTKKTEKIEVKKETMTPKVEKVEVKKETPKKQTNSKKNNSKKKKKKKKKKK